MWGVQEEVEVQVGRSGLTAGLKAVLPILRVMIELRMEMFDLEVFILNASWDAVRFQEEIPSNVLFYFSVSVI